MLIKFLKIMQPVNGFKKTFLFFTAVAMAVVVLGESFALQSDFVIPETTDGSSLTKAADTSSLPLKLESVSQSAVEAGVNDIDFTGETGSGILEAQPVENAGIQAQTHNAGDGAEAVTSEDEAAAETFADVKKRIDVAALPAQEGGFIYSEEIPMSYELQEYTYQKCVERGLEYELVLAVIWRESRFTIDAVNQNKNGTQDSGIMQINDINKEWLLEKHSIDDLMDPYQNIDAGTAMLGDLTDKYGVHGAMLAYQYGETGMARKVRNGETTSSLIELAYRQRDYYRKIV